MDTIRLMKNMIITPAVSDSKMIDELVEEMFLVSLKRSLNDMQNVISGDLNELRQESTQFAKGIKKLTQSNEKAQEELNEQLEDLARQHDDLSSLSRNTSSLIATQFNVLKDTLLQVKDEIVAKIESVKQEQQRSLESLLTCQDNMLRALRESEQKITRQLPETLEAITRHGQEHHQQIDTRLMQLSTQIEAAGHQRKKMLWLVCPLLIVQFILLIVLLVGQFSILPLR
jgi:DNA repair exonuclease SbcCD ATPase subunit